MISGPASENLTTLFDRWGRVRNHGPELLNMRIWEALSHGCALRKLTLIFFSYGRNSNRKNLIYTHGFVTKRPSLHDFSPPISQILRFKVYGQNMVKLPFRPYLELFGWFQWFESRSVTLHFLELLISNLLTMSGSTGTGFRWEFTNGQ